MRLLEKFRKFKTILKTFGKKYTEEVAQNRRNNTDNAFQANWGKSHYEEDLLKSADQTFIASK